MKYAKSNRNPFFIGLREEVDNYFNLQKISVHANSGIAVKATLLLGVLFGSYWIILDPNSTRLSIMMAYIILGLASVMIVFNLVHDASHKALSRKKWINNLVRYLGDFVGINTYIWDIRHNIQHHAYTNILGGDLIIENIPLVRLSKHQPYRWFHKYQLFYAPFLYMLYTFYWMMIIDFKLFFAKNICGHEVNHTKKEWSILFLGKIFYLSYTIVIPWLLSSYHLGFIILCFFLMHMAAGILLSTVAVLGHFVDGPSFPEVRDGIIDNSWSEHELEATIDFAPKSKVVNWITGGLNTHVAHHLFPHICHIHYYALTKVIEKYCYDHGYQYSKESLIGGLQSHVRYLKKLSLPNP